MSLMRTVCILKYFTRLGIAVLCSLCPYHYYNRKCIQNDPARRTQSVMHLSMLYHKGSRAGYREKI